MKTTKAILAVALMFMLLPSLYAQKTVYIPRFITNTNMNLNDTASQWCYQRSRQTDNIVIFWEKGFGSDPSTVSNSTYRVNIGNLLVEAEKVYKIHIDTLGFAVRGASVTDRHKLMIFLLYQTEWAAYGSGQDDLVGTLHVNPAAARSVTTVGHEIGHCFQYITGCDTQGGYRYGFGANGAGGNGFWEQCAQWQSFKVYPASQFGGVGGYVASNHLHILHETPRYQNYFIQDYWAYKHGIGFIGKLWRDSRRPEDPVETYKRITSVSQAVFNDQIHEHAARLTTWDIPAIRSYGASHINARAQVKMSLTSGNFWRVDSTVTPENYGYNCIKLNAPSSQTEVKVLFRGLAGTPGYRALNMAQGGWRYSFVALLKDGSRVYSPVGSANVANGQNPTQTLSFVCPNHCDKLWLVVSGAPQQHWRHPWDDNNSNDEQWPYEVQFENTNLLGVYSNAIKDLTLTYDVEMQPMADYTPVVVALSESQINQAFAMPTQDIVSALGAAITYYGINPDNTQNATSTANAPGHWYTATGQTVAWGANAFCFSELKLATMQAHIGQYPARVKDGDMVTLKQALVYRKSATETATVTLVFNVKIKSGVVSSMADRSGVYHHVALYPNPTRGMVYLGKDTGWTLLNQQGMVLASGQEAEIDVSELPAGLYYVKTDNLVHKLVKE